MRARLWPGPHPSFCHCPPNSLGPTQRAKDPTKGQPHQQLHLNSSPIFRPCQRECARRARSQRDREEGREAGRHAHAGERLTTRLPSHPFPSSLSLHAPSLSLDCHRYGLDVHCSDREKAGESSTSTFVTALVLNVAIAGAEIAIFTLIRRKFKTIYEPRTFIPQDEK